MVFLKRLIYLLPLILLAGCARNYHCYPHGQVNCNYRIPNPLPYSVSESSNCLDSTQQGHRVNLQAEMSVMVDALENSQNASN